jgi:DNA replication protein DnaC
MSLIKNNKIYKIMLGQQSKFYKECIKEGYIGVNYNINLDLNESLNFSQKDFSKFLFPIYQKKNSEKSKKAGELAVSTVYKVCKELQIGDYILASNGESGYKVGIISGDYEYISSKSLIHTRKVNWTNETIERASMSQKLKNSSGTSQTLGDLTNYNEEINTLINKKVESEKNMNYDSEIVSKIVNSTLLEESKVLNILDAMFVENNKQLIFSGPPGTGKTWVAKAIAKHITDEDCVEIVQFHPSYGYEEFMIGLRPEGKDGGIEFKPHKGVVVELAEKAQENPDKTYILIIDEMNRGNLPKIFGELMFLFEYRDQEMSLQYELDSTNTKFKLPENLYFIGTMNTADRSIATIDAALRRRFDIFEFPPSREMLQKFYERPENSLEYKNLLNGMEELNNRLKNQLGTTNQLIGHTFFMKEKLDKKELRHIWDRKIEPQLEEYFYDDEQKLANFQFDTLFN